MWSYHICHSKTSRYSSMQPQLLTYALQLPLFKVYSQSQLSRFLSRLLTHWHLLIMPQLDMLFHVDLLNVHSPNQGSESSHRLHLYPLQRTLNGCYISSKGRPRATETDFWNPVWAAWQGIGLEVGTQLSHLSGYWFCWMTAYPFVSTRAPSRHPNGALY